MRSSFSGNRRVAGASSSLIIDETYDLRGNNLILPDQVMKNGESPYTINSRMYAREDGESRVAIRTRKGSTSLTTPLGETVSTLNTATSTGDMPITTTTVIAQPFTAGATGLLTKLELELKRVATSVGHVIVELRTDGTSAPGTLISTSSIKSSDITTSYAYLAAKFMDAPAVVSGTVYWIALYIQDNGSGTYYVNQTADAGTADVVSSDDMVSWSALSASFRFKSYVATAEPVKGFHRRYPSDGRNLTLFAVNGDLYKEDGGTVTSIDSTVDTTTDFMRFAETDDKTVYVTGMGAPRWFDGDAVEDVANAPTGASLVKMHQGRLFFLTEKTRWSFSDLYSFESYPSVNFFYVPSPKSSDPVTAARTFQDNFVIWTHETKHIVYGTDLSSFTRKEAIGTKGAVCDEAVAIDRNVAYFMSDDGQIYGWNGSSDNWLSQAIETELRAIPNKTKVRLHLYNNQLRVYYSKSGAANDRMALLDIESGQWFLDTGRYVLGSMELAQDNSELIEFSSLAGWLFNGETGQSDVGKPIDFKYWTNYKIYGSGASRKRVKRFRPVLRTIDADYTLLVGKDMDFANDPDMREYIVSGGGAKWGAFIFGDGTKFGRARMIDRASGMSGRGRYIQYRFERNGVDTPVELYGYIAQVKVGRPK